MRIGGGRAAAQGARRVWRQVVGGNVPGALLSRSAGRWGSATGSPFVPPANLTRRPRPIPAPLPFIPSLELGAGEGRGRSRSQRGGFSLVGMCREGSLSPFCGVAGSSPGRWSWAPGARAARGAPWSGPIVPPPPTRSCLWPGAGGGPAPGVAVRSCSRSDRSGGLLPTRVRPAGGICVRAGLVVATLTPVQDPAVSPPRSASPSANKGKTPAPSPPAPTSEREGERVVPSGFSALRPSDLGVCNPPLSLPPLTYAKWVHLWPRFPCRRRFPVLGRGRRHPLSLPYYLHLRSRGVSGHSCHCIWGRGPWARCLDWEGPFSKPLPNLVEGFGCGGRCLHCLG